MARMISNSFSFWPSFLLRVSMSSFMVIPFQVMAGVFSVPRARCVRLLLYHGKA
jgi:hypothetical protein